MVKWLIWKGKGRGKYIKILPVNEIIKKDNKTG